VASTLGKNDLKSNSEVPPAIRQIIWQVGRYVVQKDGMEFNGYVFSLHREANKNYKLRLSIAYLLILFTVYLTKPRLSQIIQCITEGRFVNCELKGFERK